MQAAAKPRVPNFAPRRGTGRPPGRPIANARPVERGRRVVPVAKPATRACSPRHPWEAWFRRGKFTLRKGVHFTNRADVMAQQARNYACRRFSNIRLSIRISPTGDRLTVTVVEVDPS